MKAKAAFLISILFLTVAPAIVSAVPANPTPFILEHPGGSKFSARQVGDERNAWIETLEGYTITQNLQGQWVYAGKGRLSQSEMMEIITSEKFKGLSGTHILRPTNKIVGKDLPEGLEKHIIPVLEETPTAEKIDGKILEKEILPEKSSPLYQSAQSQESPSYSPGTTGTEYVVVIPIQFTDVTFSSGYDQAFYENLIFNESNPGSMNSYYKEVSYDLLNVTGIVAPVVNSNHTMAYYGADICSGIDTGKPPNCVDIYELAREAVQLANPYVDFSQYDKDGDGYVDHLLIIHAGNGQESSDKKNDIWSHAWVIYPSESVDDVNAYEYTMLAETSPVGTFAHEFGHDLGLPDLYKTTAPTASVVGYWDLMDYGSWGGSPAGTKPTHISTWGKDQLDWLTPITVAGEINVNIDQIETNQEAYRLDDIQLSSENEYFLVENRQKAGFDAGLPGSYNTGLVIWHIDNKQSNNNGTIKMVMPELAGGSLNTAPFASDYGYTSFNSASTPNTNTNEGDETIVYAIDIGSSGSSMAATLFGGIPRLEAYTITESKSVAKDQFFSFSAGVKCVDGACGDVNALLKQGPAPLPTTCSEIWGGDCSEGPPESFDNTFNDCNYGAGGDESIEEIYLNKDTVGFGEEIEVKCLYTTKSGIEYTEDMLYIYYRNNPSGTWVKKAEHNVNFIGALDKNYSAIFVPDSVEGEHQVRCMAGYDISGDECAEAGSAGPWYDNDDANFTVINNIISTTPEATPFYTTSPQPQTCLDMNAGENCELTWDVNATGDLGTYKLLAVFNSNLPIPQAESERVNITIVEEVGEFVSITLSGYPIDFSSLDPGTNDNAATGNASDLYVITVDSSTTVNVDLYQEGTNFIGADMIVISNMHWNTSNTTSGYKTMDFSYNTLNPIATGVTPGTGTNLYYWLTIPTGKTAGSYSSNISIKAVKVGEAP